MNVDRNTVTAADQSEKPADIAITKSIRQSIVGTADFSTSAKNITVVSIDGVVTLKGSVASGDEKRRIETIAHDVASVQRVESQLTVQ